MNSNYKKYFFEGLAVLFVLTLSIFFANFARKGGVEEERTGPREDVPQNKESSSLPTIEGGTREVLSQNLETPEPDSALVRAGVAIPESVVQTGPAAIRKFQLRGDEGKYIPETIVVNELDVVHIVFTAIDGDYNLSFSDFGVSEVVRRGETAQFQFQAYPFGQYKFFCKDVCLKNVSGTLIVNKK